MSYILEALRRADAERALGRTPDLHAQPLPSVADDALPAPKRRGAWIAGLVTAGTVAAVLVAIAAGWLRGGGDTAADAEQAASPPTAGAGTAAMQPGPQPAAPSHTAATSAPSTSPAPAPPLAHLPPLPPPAPKPAAAAPTRARDEPTAAASTRAGPAATEATQAHAAAQPPTATVRPALAAPAGAADEAPPSWGSLPEVARRELPPLAFGGTVYSEQRAARLLLLNGRVFREGEAITPELEVEQIGPRSAVLRHRGQRFSLP